MAKKTRKLSKTKISKRKLLKRKLLNAGRNISNTLAKRLKA